MVSKKNQILKKNWPSKLYSKNKYQKFFFSKNYLVVDEVVVLSKTMYFFRLFFHPPAQKKKIQIQKMGVSEKIQILQKKFAQKVILKY